MTMLVKPSRENTSRSAGFFAGRATSMAKSASNAAGQRARELVAAGRSIANLTIGEPDFETPKNIREAAVRAINSGQTRYTNVDGTPALKAAVIKKFGWENGLQFEQSQITVGAGAKQIIFNALMATVEKDDEVIVPAPHWVSYPEMVSFAGGTPVILRCGANQGFKLLPEQLESAITTRTKWLILNSPSNPTGAVYTRAELVALGAVLQKHPHVWVMTDDIYEHIIYDDQPFATVGAAVPELLTRCLTINGVSKAYAMTGWRLGYAGGPKELITEMAKIQSQSTGNPCSISQAAAVEALSGTRSFVEIHRKAFWCRRDVAMEEFARIPELHCERPGGAFYVFPSCQALIGKTTPGGTAIANDQDFASYLLECGVATVAGTPFGMPNHFRISFACSEEVLREGCQRIASACRALS